MRYRPSHQTKRRICGVMVLVWLFAVLTSTVNACVLSATNQPGAEWHAVHDDEADHGHGHAVLHSGFEAHDAFDDEATHGLHSEHAGVIEHDHEHDHHDDGHAGCHKFCKDESATLTKYKSVDGPDFSIVLTNSSAKLLPIAQAAMPAQRMQERPQAQGPPLVIRFLRLAL